MNLIAVVISLCIVPPIAAELSRDLGESSEHILPFRDFSNDTIVDDNTQIVRRDMDETEDTVWLDLVFPGQLANEVGCGSLAEIYGAVVGFLLFVVQESNIETCHMLTPG